MNVDESQRNSTSPESVPAVELVGVSKVYRQEMIEVQALTAVDLRIERGSFLSISGPSGSGKTTLLNILGGLDVPSSGTVSIGGKRLDTLSTAERAEFRLHHVGFVFQSYNLIPVLSAAENVAFVLQLQGVPYKERTDRAVAILGEVGLSGMESRRPSALSGGQQQRVAVARAIISNPDFVLADEPTANLDSNTASSLLELMQQMNQEKGITFVFSTHDALVMQYARRRIKLHDGRISQDEHR